MFVEFSLKPVYPIMDGESFQIFGVHITGEWFCESKIESSHHYSCPPANYSSPQVAFFRKSVPPPSRKGEENYE